MREVKIDSMDCHALQSKARNDRKRASFPPQDFFTRLQIFLSTKSKNTYRILGFLMRKQAKRCKALARKQVSLVNRGFQAIGKGVTLGGNDRRQSRRIHDLSQNKRSGASAAQQVSLEKDKIPQRLENA